MEKSVSATMKHLVSTRKTYGAFAPTIKDTMTPQGVGSIFFDENGFFKEDAAENRLWADPATRNVYLGALLKQQGKSAKEEATLEDLSRRGERPRTGGATKKTQPKQPVSTKETFLAKLQQQQ